MKSPEDHLLNFDFDECGNLKFDKRNNAPTLKNQYYNFDAAMELITWSMFQSWLVKK